MAFKIRIVFFLSKVETLSLHLWTLFLWTLPTSSSVICIMSSYLEDYFTPNLDILMHVNCSHAYMLPFQVIPWVLHSFPSLHLLFLLVPHRKCSLPCRLAQLKWSGAINNESCLWKAGQSATNTFLPLNLLYLLYCCKVMTLHAQTKKKMKSLVSFWSLPFFFKPDQRFK